MVEKIHAKEAQEDQKIIEKTVENH